MLPILTTLDDVREIVRYLKTKPTGATIAEAKSVLKKHVLDPRKINAFQFWQIVEKQADRIKLARVGWDLARKPQSQAEVVRNVLDSVVPYRSALEWMHHQGLETVTNNDVAAHWHEHHADIASTSREATLKDSVVCFFHLCHGANLGKLTIGRKGQTTRRVPNREELAKHIEGGPTAPPILEGEAVDATSAEADSKIRDAAPELGAAGGPAPGSGPPESVKRLRVFIAHGKNMQIVEQVQTMLDLAGIESEVAEEEETAAIPVPDKVFGAMHRCKAGVLIVSVEEGRRDASGNYALNENVLIEVGAAYVLYDRRIILLWDKRLPVPSNVQGLYRCEFEGDQLSWSAGMKLMKGVQNFKK